MEAVEDPNETSRRCINIRSLFAAFILSIWVSAAVAFTALVCSLTSSIIYIIFVMCGSIEGYLFFVMVLSFAVVVLRQVYCIVSNLLNFCCRNIKVSKDVCFLGRYQRLPSVTNTTTKQQCETNEDTTKKLPLEPRHRRLFLFDMICILLLYFLSCFLAWLSWAPPVVDLNTENIRFPVDFQFGAATSAYQVEGNLFNNQWAEFEQGKGNIMDDQHCGEAADMWNRFDYDLENIRDLELDSFRFSVEWSRIGPQQGIFNETALNTYATWITKLQAQGIEPIVTLHHFTNPLWFEQLGAFENPEAATLILPYVRKVVEKLGAGVERWITINEIMVYAGQGYLEGEFPPGRNGEVGTMLRVVSNMLQAHHRMYDTIKEINPDAKVSIAKNTILYHPWSYLDLGAIISAAVADLYYNALPVRVLQHQKSIDYFGLNSYIRLITGPMGLSMGFTLPTEHQSDMGWDLEPSVLYQVVRQYSHYDPKAEIIITEHGTADGDEPDNRRVNFLRDSLTGLAKAVQEGVPVTGYLHWSLIDNWEWSSGFSPKFGLYSINLPHDQERKLTKGGKFYKELIQSHHHVGNK